MEFWPLDVTVISAKDLKDCQLIGKMDVYAVVSINNDYSTKQKTPVDKDCGTKPKWNHHMKFTIDLAAVQQNWLNLVFQLKADRSFGDKIVGEVTVPIKELLDRNNGAGKLENMVSYRVRMANGKYKGTLNFSYKFGEKFDGATSVNQSHQPPVMTYPPTRYPGSHGQPSVDQHHEPVMAYPPAAYPGGSPGGYPPNQPPHHPGLASGYPTSSSPGKGNGPVQYPYPPQPSHGYGGYPPAPGYGYSGYPPQQGGQYGYPPVLQQPKPQKQKKHGMGGMGLGLGAGLLGGLLVGEMVEDVAEAASFDF